VVVVAVVALNGVSMARQNRTYHVPPVTLSIASDSETVARGRHLVSAVSGCMSCHAPDLGGQILIDKPAIGTLSGANITHGRGGLPTDYRDDDWVRAIRHGVGRDSHSLLFMPSDAFQSITDADVSAMVAYLRTASPVDRTLPPKRVGILARVLHVVAGFPLLSAERVDHAATRPDAAPDSGSAFGEYLVNAGGCRGCHGAALAGGPVGPDITPRALNAWSHADFVRAIRQGQRPDGRRLSEEMPWRFYAGMTDRELLAVWGYLQGVRAPGK
jgi:mono/diheme cytochrome c family protein